MNSFKKIFINYAPIFLIFPLSLAVGLYAFREMEVLLRGENRLFFYYYVGFAATPIYFILFRTRQDFGQEILEIVGKFTERFFRHKWAYLAIGVVFSIFYLYIASIHISTYYERDRWILNNDLPILPIDLVLPSRLALVISWFVPTDIAIPLLSLVFILIWLAFLIYINGGEGNSWVLVFLVFIATFFTGTLYTTQYATYELTAALLGFIGLYGIWKRKFNIGFFFLIFGSIFKNTGVFQIATGAVLFAFVCWQDGSFRRVFNRIDLSLFIFLGIYFIANHWGSFYYISVLRGGPGYLINPNPEQIFWWSSFITFSRVLLRNYTLLLIFGLTGSILYRRAQVFFLFSIGVLLFLRSFSRWADDGYSMIFIPGLSFFSIYGIAYLWNSFGQKWKKAVLAFIVTGISMFILINLLSNFPSGMHRLNSNFDEFVAYTADNFPRDGRIYQREISLIPYLRNYGRSAFDDIEFDQYPESKDVVIEGLLVPGCRMIIMVKNDLGITEEDLMSIGFSDKPYSLHDDSGLWVVYTRDCE